MSVCARCVRALRKQARIEQLTARNQQSLRLLSTTPSHRQTTNPQPDAPAVIPTTASTVTTNIAADIPRKTQAPKSPPLSTSEMQKRINQNLSRGPGSITDKLAATLRRTAKNTTESYITYGITEVLFKSCAAQAAYTVPEDLRMGIYTGKGPPKNARQEDVGIPEEISKNSWWFSELGLEPTFSVWSQVCFLHMYILTVKLRTLETQKLYLDYQRYLMEHFSNAAEDKMGLLHGMSARGIRNKYLKDLFIQWRGLLYAYDQGLVAGDAVLAGAVWRNLWKADENVDWTKVAMVVGFMRRSIAGLADVEVHEITSSLKDSSAFWDGAKEGLEQMVARPSNEMRSLPQ